MNLSLEEENFLRHWIHDEAHYEEGLGAAKRIQLQNSASPADLAVLIAAAFPDLADQEAAVLEKPSPSPPIWPWQADQFAKRLVEGRAILAARNPGVRAAAVSLDTSSAAP